MSREVHANAVRGGRGEGGRVRVGIGEAQSVDGRFAHVRLCVMGLRYRKIIDDVAEQAITATLAGAVATGQAEMQRLVASLQEQLRAVTVQREAAKTKSTSTWAPTTISPSRWRTVAHELAPLPVLVRPRVRDVQLLERWPQPGEEPERAPELRAILVERQFTALLLEKGGQVILQLSPRPLLRAEPGAPPPPRMLRPSGCR